MNARWGIAVLFFLSLIAASPAFAGYPYVGLYGDTLGGSGGATRSRTQTWALEPFDWIEIWVWWLPDPSKGMTGGEYMITSPSFLLLADWIQNPSTTALTLGDPYNGLAFTFTGNNCQYDWYWSDRLLFLARSTTQYGDVQILPDPAVSNPPNSIIMTSCEPNFPIYPCMPMNDRVGVNYIRCYPLPLNGAIPLSSNVLNASFVRLISSGCGGYEFKSIFRLYPKSAPLDTIIIDHASPTCPNYFDGCDNFNINLAEPMVDGTTYVLEANNYIESCVCANAVGLMCLPLSDCPNYSKLEFTFSASIATLLQSSSASLRGSGIEVAWELSSSDEGTSFFISRSENGGEFRMLDASGLVRDGLHFTYLDRSVEPGKSYSYKVEYGAGAPSRTLFICEEVSTPAMPLTLYQNKPNPFNPSTTISFYLPQESVVGLEVYDVSGRLVSRLIAGERRSPGTHSIEWNGRDTGGTAVASGVYLYRLTAGKETVSKKMVLLR